MALNVMARRCDYPADSQPASQLASQQPASQQSASQPASKTIIKHKQNQHSHEQLANAFKKTVKTVNKM
jgi:hypothetical protein